MSYFINKLATIKQPYKYFDDTGHQKTFGAGNRPSAIQYNGTSYVCYLGWDGSSDTMYINITRFWHSNTSWSGIYTIKTVNKSVDKWDAHEKPAVAIDNKGHIYVFYGGHYTHEKRSSIYYKKSSNPEDISSWQNEQTFNASNDNITYKHVVFIDKTLYLFTREYKTDYKRILKLYYTSNGGVTWSEQNILEADNVYIYPGNFYWDGTYIHLLTNWRDGSSGTYGEMYYVYYLKYKPSNNHVYAADGTDLGITANVIEADNHKCKIVGDGHNPTTGYGLEYDTVPYVSYCKYDGSNYDIWYAKWNNTSEKWERVIVSNDLPNVDDWRCGSYCNLEKRGKIISIYETNWMVYGTEATLGKFISYNDGKTWGKRKIAKNFTGYLPNGLFIIEKIYNYSNGIQWIGSELTKKITVDELGRPLGENAGNAKLFMFDSNWNYVNNSYNHL